MVTAQPHWRKVGRTSSSEIYDWYNLPVQIQPQHVVPIQLSSEEAASICAYAAAYFDKEFIDKLPSQWASSKGPHKTNPNEIGIRGEYAGAKYFDPTISLKEFLAYRPWKMADMGDAVFVGHKAKVFDYKTRTRQAPIDDLIVDDAYMAEMSAQFSNRNKYGYLQAFIFCVNNPRTNMISLMGWLPADVFFAKAQFVPRGDKVPGAYMPYSTDELLVPYRRLRPIAELKELRYCPINEQMTLRMREDWNRGVKQWDVAQYLENLS